MTAVSTAQDVQRDADLDAAGQVHLRALGEGDALPAVESVPDSKHWGTPKHAGQGGKAAGEPRITDRGRGIDGRDCMTQLPKVLDRLR